MCPYEYQNKHVCVEDTYKLTQHLMLKNKNYFNE